MVLFRYFSGVVRVDFFVVNWGGRLGSIVLFVR